MPKIHFKKPTANPGIKKLPLLSTKINREKNIFYKTCTHPFPFLDTDL